VVTSEGTATGMAARNEDERLVRQAQQGDQDALAEIYERYQPAVYRYVYYRVRDVSAAEDLTAAVFLRVVEKLDSFRYEGRPLLAWLYTIAANTVIDYHRRAERSRVVPLDGEVVDRSRDVERAVERRLTQRRLADALAELTEEQRQVITLRFVEGMTSKEVGRVLDKSTGAVKALQHRGLASLARILRTEAL
jgi:RNA polymerase sigma-70 factor (ECF subfamily)